MSPHDSWPNFAVGKKTMSSKNRNEEFIDGFDDDIDSVIPFTETITSYGADFPVDTIIRRIADDDIYVPIFQRRYIWNESEASRFIESLLLGLPVPGVFLAKDPDGRHMIIDGQQRLLSIYYFISGERDKKFKLSGVGGLFNGHYFEELSAEYRRRLLDSIIHATIVRQDNQNFENSSIFHIFERLNTGGKQLEPQEIRNCMYPGKFQDLLSDINSSQPWRSIYGNPSLRYKDQELVLRFIALYLNVSDYAPPVKAFLNRFMGRNRNIEDPEIVRSARLFNSVIELLHVSIGEKLFRPNKNFNAAIFDAITYGIAKRLERGAITSQSDVKKEYDMLLDNPEFKVFYSSGTSSETSVKGRLKMAAEAFSEVA